MPNNISRECPRETRLRGSSGFTLAPKCNDIFAWEYKLNKNYVWSEGGKAQPPLSGIGLLARVPGSAPGQLGACVRCVCGVCAVGVTPRGVGETENVKKSETDHI